MELSTGQFKIGEVITAYHSGYHVVVSITFRDNASDLLGYVQIANNVGKRVNGKATRECDASYCKKVTHARLAQHIDIQRAKLEEERLNLQALVEEFHVDLE